MSSPGRPTSSMLRSAPTQHRKRKDTHSSDPSHLPFTHFKPPVEHQRDALLQSSDLSTGDGTWPRRSEPSFHNRTTSQTHVAHSGERRSSLAPSFIMSSMSSMPSRTSPSPAKQSGFRATMRRVFGSKYQRAPIPLTSAEVNYSDPGNLIANEGQQTRRPGVRETYQSGRPATRPVTRSVALGSHTPSTTALNQRPGPVPTTSSYPRRNSLPSLVLSDHEAQNFATSLNNHLDGVDASSRPVLDPSLSETRRSRSLQTLLRDQQSHQPSVQRQSREAEIAYWRSSVLTDPASSMPAAIVDDDNGIGLVEDTSDNGDEDDDDDDVETRLGSPQLSRLPATGVKPVQSFDFGLSVGDEPVDLEDRVNTLEVKMYDFEYAIAKLQGVQLPKPALQPRMMRSKSNHDFSARASHHSTSTDSSARRMMSFSRPRPSPSSATAKPDSGLQDHASRLDVVRPKTSHTNRSPSPPTSMRITRTEYDALVALISDEKAARQQMEMQIMTLQKDIEQLQSPIYANIKYPRPDLHGPLETPRVKTLHRTTPFDFSRTPPPSQSRFSVDTETEFQNDSLEDVDQTPRQGFTFDVTRRSPMVNVAVI